MFLRGCFLRRCSVIRQQFAWCLNSNNQETRYKQITITNLHNNQTAVWLLSFWVLVIVCILFLVSWDLNSETTEKCYRISELVQTSLLSLYFFIVPMALLCAALLPGRSALRALHHPALSLSPGRTGARARFAPVQK